MRARALFSEMVISLSRTDTPFVAQATSNFITDAVAVEQIGVDYATLALNSLTPIRFTIRTPG